MEFSGLVQRVFKHIWTAIESLEREGDFRSSLNEAGDKAMNRYPFPGNRQ